MKPSTDMNGADFMRFTSAMKHILMIPKEEILRREAEYKAKANLNPRKRGPKPKTKPVASRGPDASPLA